MNYQESIDYLEKEIGFASCPGLERITNLLEKLGNPEKRLKIIHVAGTNGKGSATALLCSILAEGGYRVGGYTSPHLARYNERFVINGTEISDDAFSAILTKTKIACEQLVAEGLECPTLFEVITGAAFLYFAEEKVDLLVLEVGLGGKYDATNVVEAPLVSIIMSISMDHTEFLGNTLAQIAEEKAGIIKKNCPVVLYSQEEVVYNIVKSKADSLGATLFYPKDANITLTSQTIEGTTFDVAWASFQYQNIFLPLLGQHQIQNCITVLAACEVLKQKGFPLSAQQILQGVSKTTWAGRMEILKNAPMVILDGAHNVDGIQRLAESIPVYFKNKKITLILGILGDKEYEKMADTILPLAHRVIFSEPHSERRLEASALASTMHCKTMPFYIEPQLESAYQKALEITKDDEIILCCGSLYMIGALRSYIVAL